jgi:hypothetical protein
MRAGLPQTGCFFTVLRQAMAGDARDPAGVYFGTNSGSVFASLDEGETWRRSPATCRRSSRWKFWTGRRRRSPPDGVPPIRPSNSGRRFVPLGRPRSAPFLSPHVTDSSVITTTVAMRASSAWPAGPS